MEGIMGEGECIRRLMIRCLVGVGLRVGNLALGEERRRGLGMILWGRGMGRHGEGWGGFLGAEGAAEGWEGRSGEDLVGISYEVWMAVRLR